MTTASKPHIVSTQVPPSARDDYAFVRALLEQVAARDGLVLDGEPTMERRDGEGIEVDGKTVYPFGDFIYVAECRAVRPAPVEKWVPSEETVTHVAKVIQSRNTRTDWDDLPAHIKNAWMRVSLEVLVRSAPLIVADSLRHVADHLPQFGVEDAPFAESLLRGMADRAERQE